MLRQEVQLLKLISEHQADAEQHDNLHEAATLIQILRRVEDNSHPLQVLRKAVLQLQAQPKTWRAQQQANTNEMERQLNEKEGSMNHMSSLMNEGQSSLNMKKLKDREPPLY